MKKILFSVLAAVVFFTGCTEMDNVLGGSGNRFTFEGSTRSIEQAYASRTNDSFTFKLYSDVKGMPNDYFITLTFPANLSDTLFTIPTATGQWSVDGAVDGIAFNGNTSGREGFQSMNVQLKQLDGAGTYELMFSLALDDNRCMKGYYKGRVN